MNTDIVNKMLQSLVTTLEQAKDFTLTQIPLVALELLKYRMATCIVWLVGVIIGFVVCLKLIGKVTVAIKEINIKNKGISYYDKVDVDGYYIGRVVLYLMAIVLFICIAFIVSDMIKIQLAPRLYIIDYLRETVSGCSK